eukprot:PhF_6_TR31099/c0_g1_i1/m.45488
MFRNRVLGTERVVCEHCKKLFDAAHKDHCAQRPVTCKACGAGPMQAYTFVTKHLTKECPQKPTVQQTAANKKGAGVEGSPVPNAVHEVEEGRPNIYSPPDQPHLAPVVLVKCPKCSEQVADSEMEYHSGNQCPHRTVVCSTCFKAMEANELEAHQKDASCSAPKQKGVLGLEISEKMVVTTVRDNSPAAKAGIKINDVIVSVRGRPTRAKPEFLAVLQEGLFVGDEVAIEIKAGGQGGVKVMRAFIEPPLERKRSIGRALRTEVGNTQGKTIEELTSLLADEEKFTSICRQCFDFVDTNKNGTLDRLEIRELMYKLSVSSQIDPPTWEENDEMFRKIDTDNDGVISFDEFKPVVRKMLEERLGELKAAGAAEGTPRKEGSADRGGSLQRSGSLSGRATTPNRQRPGK